MGKERRSIQSVDNAFELVDILKNNGAMTLSELSEAIDLSKGTVHTYLSTLSRHGLVAKTGDGKYELGIMFVQLGLEVREQIDIYRYGKKEAQKLAQDTGDVVHLAIGSGGVVRVLYSAKGDTNLFDGETPVGGTLQMHATALGKALLASYPDEKVNEIVETQGLEPLTKNTLTDRDELFEELEQIRAQGYADNFEETAMGARTIATDVQRPNGDTAGAIGITGTTSRFETKGEEPIKNGLFQSADQIEIYLQRNMDTNNELDGPVWK